MVRSNPRIEHGLSILCLLAAAWAWGCSSAPAPAHGGPAQHAGFGTPQAPAGRDDLLGWYMAEGGEPVLVVLKRAGAYYSICRGFEVPFKESPAGLEWAVSPSSMTGTTIGHDQAAGTYYLAVFDTETAHFSDGRAGCGEKRALTRIAEPAWVLDPTAAPPRALDDFLGWYQPIWFPYMRWELRKDGATYEAVFAEYDAAWRQDYRRTLAPLGEGLGFTGFEKGSDITLTYNDALRRFELTAHDPVTVRMPLARIAPPTAMDAPPPQVRIGIPSWH